MTKFRRLRQKHDFNFKGTMSESYLCIDCGFDAHPGNLNRAESQQDARAQIASGRKNWRQLVQVDSRSETYFVHNHIWKAAGMEPWGGCLCIGCIEKRIGRRLIPEDFADHIFNTYYPGTPRLLERQGRYDPLGEWEAA
jgi:hypothetical protein